MIIFVPFCTLANFTNLERIFENIRASGFYKQLEPRVELFIRTILK